MSDPGFPRPAAHHGIWAAAAAEIAERLRRGAQHLAQDGLTDEERTLTAYHYGRLMGQYRALCVMAGVTPEAFPPLTDRDRSLAQRLALAKALGGRTTQQAPRMGRRDQRDGGRS